MPEPSSPLSAQGETPRIDIPAQSVPPGTHIPPAQVHERAGATLKVHGEEKAVSYEELISHAQKGLAADENFQAAAEKSKDAETAIQFQEDMRLVTESGDINAFRRAGAALGMPGDKIEQTAQYIEAQFERAGVNYVNPESPDESPAGSRPESGKTAAEWAKELAALKAQVEGKQVGFGDLTGDLQTALVNVEEERISQIVEKALDSDPTLSYYMNSYGDKGKTAVRGVIDEKIRGRLDASDGRFGDGAKIMNVILPEVKTLLEAIGPPERSTPQMGLGPAPGGQGPNIHPLKAPEHVSSKDSGFEEHIGEVLEHNIRKAQG